MKNLNIQKLQKGFTLIELMIVDAIIGILAAIAIPAYQDYLRRAKCTEVVQATQAVKVAVEVCAQDNGGIANCDAGSEGIPADVGANGSYVASVATANGIITATAVNAQALLGETYILTPVYSLTTGIRWDVTGTCVAATICKD